MRLVYDDPSIIQYLNSDQKKEYSKKLKDKVKNLKFTEDQYAYVSTRPQAFKYLSRESKPTIIDMGFKNGIDMWTATSETEEDINLYEDEIELLLKNCLYVGGDNNDILKKTAKFMPADRIAIMLEEKFKSTNRMKFVLEKNPGLENETMKMVEIIDTILDNFTEQQLADFFDSNIRYRELIPFYQDKYDLARILLENDKYHCMDYLTEEKRLPFIQRFQSLSVEEQIKYAEEKEILLKYLPPEEQAKLIVGKLEKLEYCSLDGKKAYIKNNPNDFYHIDEKSKIQLVAEDIRLFDFLSPDLQMKVKSSLKVPEHRKIYGKFLKKDINTSRDFNYEEPDNSEAINDVLRELFRNPKSMDDETAVKYILKSKLFSAIGKLTGTQDILHRIPAGRERIYGIDDYTIGQVSTIQSLNLSAVEKLVKIDTNYVLPYLAFTNNPITSMSPEDRISSEERAKKLFSALYGKDKYAEYEECFKTIYDLQEEYEKKDIKYRANMNKGLDAVENFDEYNYHMNVPLEEFKILFNPQIIEKCNPALIKEYHQALKNHEETKTIFEKIIETTYGERAVALLKSRPQLNVHTINSLECLDERIFNTYGEAFVHDTISYNIRDFSEFLEVVKNPEKNELFKNYYNILSGILGNNVETMQKAITEFSYVSDLLKDIKDVELSEEKVLNLLNVLCSERNSYNIQTLEDLEQFNEKANEQLQKLASDKNEMEMNYIKEEICQNLFGIHFIEKSNYGYGISLEKLAQLYDISEGETSKGEYSSEEKKLINILDYIYKETKVENLKSFIKNLKDESNFRNYSSIIKLVYKIQERELSQMNNHITTTEKLDKICLEQAGEVNPSVYKEEIDGVPIYHLNGEPFCLFMHDKGHTSLEDILSFEGQGR